MQLLTKAQILLTHESFVRNTPDEYFHEVMEQAAKLSSLCAEVLEARQEHLSPVGGMLKGHGHLLDPPRPGE